MGSVLAAYYTPDDDLEHAAISISPAPGQNSGFPINDVTFSPSTGGRLWPAAGSTLLDSLRIVAATYSPIDGRRYVFYPTQTNAIHWVRFDGNYKNPKIDSEPTNKVNDLIGYAQNSIIDMAAHFAGNQIELVVLMANGDLWRMTGAPWSSRNAPWGLIPFWWKFTGTQRIAVFDGAGWGHIILSDAHNVTEVYYNSNSWGQVKLWTFTDNITDISACFTPDGVAHIFVAAPMNKLREIVFVPAQVPPSLNDLGTLNISVTDIGAYVKNGDKHVIMRDHQGNLYLSWFYPSSPAVHYGPWPQIHSW
jgi:hypothetical protein